MSVGIDQSGGGTKQGTIRRDESGAFEGLSLLEVRHGRPVQRRGLVFRLLIALDERHRQIWRRVEVDAFLKLTKLQPVILAVMCWPDDMLCQFEVAGCRSPGGNLRIADLAAMRIDHFGFLCGDRRVYRHLVVIRKAMRAERDAHYPRLIDGGGRCPPSSEAQAADEICDGFDTVEAAARLAAVAVR